MATVVTPTTEHPLAHAAGLELIGEFQHSGYKDPPSLVRLANGQTVQLTELLYVVLSCIDGRRGLDEIAAAVTEATGKQASPDDIRFLVDEKLRPLGLLQNPDGTEPELSKPDRLLRIRGRFTLLNERRTQQLTAPFALLFSPPVVVAVIGAFVAMNSWLFFGKGLANATRELLFSPGMLVLTFALTAASAGFHEFGHAAACRYGGAQPGVIGGGVYLVWPVFFTDVTDSYRLSRAGRLRTDLGGLYFNMVFALGMFGAWALTHYDPLLVLIPLQLLQMTHQLMPFVRLDGYYILADITGVPDLFARIKPTLESAVPGRTNPRATALKPWVRVVVTLWVLAVVPVIGSSIVFAVVGLPRLLGTVGASAARQWHGVTAAVGDHAYMAAAAGALATFAVILPGASVSYMFVRTVGRMSRFAWRRTDGHPLGRVGLAPVAAFCAFGLAWLWWPNGEYRPLHKGERWTVQETFAKARHVSSGRPGVVDTAAPKAQESPTTTTVVSTTTTTLERSSSSDSSTKDESTTTTARARTTTTTNPTTTTITPETTTP